MSLDVYLTLPDAKIENSGSGIFVREGGQTKEISREEWDEKFPGREPVVAQSSGKDDTVYDANITHNLNEMAKEAGIYKYLWRPEELDIKYARDLTTPLEVGIKLLISNPARFKEFNPTNGWGNYEGLVDFVDKYLDACRRYPNAEVSVSR